MTRSIKVRGPGNPVHRLTGNQDHGLVQTSCGVWLPGYDRELVAVGDWETTKKLKVACKTCLDVRND